MAARPDTKTEDPPPRALNGGGRTVPVVTAPAAVEPDDAHLDAVAAAVGRAVVAAAAARRAAVAGEPEEAEPPPPASEWSPAEAAQTLAGFYDRRAPAALAYCARICEPETISDAVEEAFGHVFASVADGRALNEEQLDELLRGALQDAVADRAPDDPETAGRLLAEAERAYEALSGDDAPALGRSLLGEMLGAAPPLPLQPAPAEAQPAATAPEPERRQEQNPEQQHQ